MLLKNSNTLNYPILFWNIAKFFQIVFRYLKHLDRLLEYLLFGAWNVVRSAYLQMKEEKEQDSDTQIIMNDQELV